MSKDDACISFPGFSSTLQKNISYGKELYVSSVELWIPQNPHLCGYLQR